MFNLDNVNRLRLRLFLTGELDSKLSRNLFYLVLILFPNDDKIHN